MLNKSSSKSEKSPSISLLVFLFFLFLLIVYYFFLSPGNPVTKHPQVSPPPQAKKMDNSIEAQSSPSKSSVTKVDESGIKEFTEDEVISIRNELKKNVASIRVNLKSKQPKRGKAAVLYPIEIQEAESLAPNMGHLTGSTTGFDDLIKTLYRKEKKKNQKAVNLAVPDPANSTTQDEIMDIIFPILQKANIDYTREYIADVGTGSGPYVFEYLNYFRGAFFVDIDRNPLIFHAHSINLAEKKFPLRNYKARSVWIRSSNFSTYLPANSIAAITFRNEHSWIRDWPMEEPDIRNEKEFNEGFQFFFEGVIKALKPGGVLLIIDGYPTKSDQRSKEGYSEVKAKFDTYFVSRNKLRLIHGSPRWPNRPSDQHKNQGYILYYQKPY